MVVGHDEQRERDEEGERGMEGEREWECRKRRGDGESRGKFRRYPEGKIPGTWRDLDRNVREREIYKVIWPGLQTRKPSGLG